MSSIRAPRHRALTLALTSASALALVLAACGSTVSNRAALNNDQGGLGLSVPSNGTGLPTANGVPGTNGSSLPGQIPGGNSPLGGGNTTVSGAFGPGITPTKIYVGVSYTSDAEYANRQAGVSGVTVGDEEAQWKIVINDVNKRGGIAGRQVVPVWHVFRGASNETVASQFEAACDTYTHDNHVFAVLVGQPDVPNYNACVQKSGAVHISINATDSDTKTFREFPYYVEPESLALDHFTSAEVPALVAQNYFGTNPKIGILTFDTPTYGRALYGSLLPALARYGHHVDPANIARFTPLRRNSDVGAFSSAVAGTVLKFNANDVDHVLFIEARGDLSLFFLLAAQDQRYFPRYGFNSADAPQGNIDSGAGISKRNFRGAVGIGWGPTGDLSPEDFPRSLATPEREYCLKIMRQGGQEFPDTNAESVALTTCDSLWFLKRAADAAGPVLNRKTFIAAVNGLGRLWRATDAMGTLFGSSKHDGVNAYSYYAFDESVGRMRYTGGVRLIQ